MASKVLHCYAEGRDGDWEAICLDYDIAVQGRSFEEVAQSLREAVALFLEAAADLPENDRRAVLGQRAPIAVRLKFLFSAARDFLVPRDDDTEHHQFTMPMAA